MLSFLLLSRFFMLGEGFSDPAYRRGFGRHHGLLGPQGSPDGKGRQDEVDCPAIGETDFVDSLWADG